MKRFMSQKVHLVSMLIMSVFISALAGCGGGGGGSWTAPGAAGTTVNPPVAANAAPTVTVISPLDSAVGVPVTTKIIRATFSKAMNPATIDLISFTVQALGPPSSPKVSGTIAFNAANTTATFSPTGNLADDTVYTVTVSSAAKDASGNALVVPAAGLPKNPWTFRTALAGAPSAAVLDLMSYGIASAGGITNTGATKINGNVVLNPLDRCNNVLVGTANDFGLCAGAAPTNNAGDRVITQSYPDTTTADDIRAQLLAKWNSISPAGTPLATVLGCGFIGTAGGGGAGIGCAGSPSLPPGNYISSASSTINIAGTLTLDGGGNPNAVWIIQAPSALTGEVGSQINLIGQAKASNVWWFVGSSADLKTNTIFNGNILASAAISMGTGSTSCGRLLSGAEGFGAFTFLGNMVSVPGHPSAPFGCI